MGPLMYQKDLCVCKKICLSVFLSVCVKIFVCLSEDFLHLYFCVCVEKNLCVCIQGCVSVVHVCFNLCVIKTSKCVYRLTSVLRS